MGRRRLHILRAVPPYRRYGPSRAAYTECGRQASARCETITRAEAAARIREHGRAAMVAQVCVTCARRSDAYSGIDWEDNPAALVARDADSSTELHELIVDELRAMAALVAAHPEEFTRELAHLAFLRVGAGRRPSGSRV